MSQNKPLEPRQESFCQHYVANGFNATRAAVSAGYSEDSARSIGAENLTKPDIKERIAELMGETVKRTKATADQVFEMASNAAFFDIGEFLEVEDTHAYLKDGKKLSDLPKQIRILIQAIKPKKTAFGDAIEIVFVDKMKALDMLARFHSMYRDQLTIREEGELTPEEMEELEAFRLKQDKTNESPSP